MDYRDLINKITLADCMDIMRDMPDKCIDLAIVDPPYGIGNFVQCSGNMRGDCVTWNNDIPDMVYFKALHRVSQHRIIWGANYYNCFEKGAVVWVKNQPMPNFSQCEIASCSLHNKTALYTETWTNYVNTKTTRHPCEKPVALYRWLLQNYAKPGQLILDTHSGSGSCAVACHIEKYDFIAIEKDADYHRDSVARLDEIRAQGVLF
jgi:site-specific DNA-methyltransferase (adenine-specific)